MSINSNSRREAEIFGRYLAGEKPVPLSVELYVRAMDRMSITPDWQDERLLCFLLKNPWATGLADSGLAWVRPQSVIRRKLLVMLAILETMPEHSHLFLPSRASSSFLYPAYIFLIGCRAVLKALLGAAFVKLV